MASGESHDEIEREMAALRAAMRQEARDVAASARTLADWRYHFRAHPRLFCGAAAALGYLVVPRRTRVEPRPSAPQAIRPVNGAGEHLSNGVAPAGQLGATVLALLANFAVEHATSFAARRGQEALRRYLQARAKHESPAEVPRQGESVD